MVISSGVAIYPDIRKKHGWISEKTLTAVALSRGISFHRVEQQAHCPEVVRAGTSAESSLQAER
jgi:hypothetical protein